MIKVLIYIGDDSGGILERYYHLTSESVYNKYFSIL